VTITAAATVLVEGRDGLGLDCAVDSNPAPAIAWCRTALHCTALHCTRWYADAEVGRGRELTLSTVSRHDAGTYTCLATNALGESKAKEVAIDVQCKW
jgi:hypothetical protein